MFLSIVVYYIINRPTQFFQPVMECYQQQFTQVLYSYTSVKYFASVFPFPAT